MVSAQVDSCRVGDPSMRINCQNPGADQRLLSSQKEELSLGLMVRGERPSALEHWELFLNISKSLGFIGILPRGQGCPSSFRRLFVPGIPLYPGNRVVNKQIKILALEQVILEGTDNKQVKSTGRCDKTTRKTKQDEEPIKCYWRFEGGEGKNQPVQQPWNSGIPEVCVTGTGWRGRDM